MHCEDPAVADALEAEGRTVVRWRDRNLYFGGVSAVEVRDGRLARRRRSAPRRSGCGGRLSGDFIVRAADPCGRGSAHASGGSGERGAGSVADLSRRRLAQRRRRAAIPEGGAAVSARRGVRRGAGRRRDRRAAVARAGHASGERARRRPRADGREGRAPPGRGPGVARGGSRVGARAAACGSSSCTSSRGTSRRSSCTSGSGSSGRGYRKGHYSRAGEDVDAILMAFGVDSGTCLARREEPATRRR